MGSVTSAVAACGQPCLLRADAHAVAAVSRETEDEVGKLFMVEKQASACTCHGILRYCNETKPSTTTAARLFVICGLCFVACRQALDVVLSWSHLPALVIYWKLDVGVYGVYVHIFAYNQDQIDVPCCRIAHSFVLREIKYISKSLHL